MPDLNRRLELENECIIKYKTAYPFGLNDRVNNISISSVKDDLCIYKDIFTSNFVATPRANRIRSKQRSGKYIDFDRFMGEIEANSLNEKDLIKYIKGKLFELNKNKARFLVKIFHNYKFKYSLIKDLIIDLLKFKIGSNEIDNNYKFDSYLVLNFSHKFVDLLNIPQLLYDQQLINAFPVKDTYPKVSFKYSRTLGSLTYNYSQISKNIKAEEIDEYP